MQSGDGIFRLKVGDCYANDLQSLIYVHDVLKAFTVLDEIQFSDL